MRKRLNRRRKRLRKSSDMVIFMLAVIRLRGSIKVNRDMKDTLNMLKLKRVNTMAILPDNKVALGMINKVDNFVAWGTVSQEILEKIGDNKVVRLKPPKGGLKSIKLRYPKGDLGYNGDAINNLIKKML